VILTRDLNTGATMQPDPSREIYITKALQFIPTMAGLAAYTLSGKNMLRISPGLGVLNKCLEFISDDTIKK